ncbi:MAG: hypothetical protein QMD14_05825 [Candidatus Aenigmarchaeota archaeon]|nr:hypothetical protein [Candidatus Aenigmarchaeota archaeon]
MSATTRKVNVTIALITSIMAVILNPLGISFRLFLSTLFQGAAVIVICLVFLVFFTAMISLVRGEVGRGWFSIMFGIGILLLFLSTTTGIQVVQAIFPYTIMIFLLLLIFAVIGWLLGR